MRSIAGRIAIASVSICLAACAAVAPETQPSTPQLSGQDQSVLVGQLTRKIADRDRALESLQTEAIMQYSAPGQNPPKVREQVTVKRPDNLRVEAMSAFSVALILVANRKQLSIFEPSQNKLVHAPATADALDQFIRIPMAPADAVTLLLGIAPGSVSLADRKPNAIAAEDDMTVASWNDGKSIRELGFRDGQLAMVRMRSAGGAVQYDVRYSDYHDIGGIMFPYVMQASFPAAQSRVAFRYKRPIINGDLPVSAFVLSPPATAGQAGPQNAAL